jgi:hypothetical protein
VVADLRLVVAVGAADRAGVTHRQPQRPGVGDAALPFLRETRAREARHAGMDAVGARQRRGRGIAGGTGDVEHRRRAQREPGAVDRVDVEADRRQRRQAGEVGEALDRQARWVVVRPAQRAADGKPGDHRRHARLGVALDRIRRRAQRRVVGAGGEERGPQRAGVADQDAEGVVAPEAGQALRRRDDGVEPTDGERVHDVEPVRAQRGRDRRRHRPPVAARAHRRQRSKCLLQSLRLR